MFGFGKQQGLQVDAFGGKGEQEAVEFYRRLVEDCRYLLGIRMSCYGEHVRQEFGHGSVRDWQGWLDKLSAHLGGSMSAETAAFLAGEQQAINTQRELVPTF
jgi:hypothetical protein